jgi:2-polyprenyl-3-methyl-5-hydroxy-6-metoxy-1,4-benzoquinol methylase
LELTRVVCNLCGQDDPSFLFEAEGRRIVRCKNCGLTYTNPWIENEIIYQDADYFTELNQYLLRSNEFRSIFNGILDQVEKYKQEGNLLDIGCGPGLLLDMAQRRGWNVYGFDLSHWAAEYSGKEFGIPVQCCELIDSQYEPNSFDVIILNHSLEHMIDPTGVLDITRTILKDSGILVVGVPNIDSLKADIQKARWRSLLPEQHRWHFTPVTLSLLLKNCGYYVISISMDNHSSTRRNPIARILSTVFSKYSLWINKGEAMLCIAIQQKDQIQEIPELNLVD